MSMEQPPFKESEMPRTLTEEIQAKRQKENSMENDYTTVRDLLRRIFNERQTGPERINEISNKLEPYLDLISKEQKDHILESLRENTNINNEDEFVEKIFTTVKIIVDLRSDRLDLFENIQRKHYYESQPTYKELNQLFAFEIEDEEIRLHVPPNIGTSIKDKLRLLDDGLEKLAKIVAENPNIKKVVGRSWIAGEHPELLRKLGFEVLDLEVMDDGKKNASVNISREELLKRYLKND